MTFRVRERLVDYEDVGSGPCLVFVPGSFSTTAAWRGVADGLKPRFRIVTTSLLGYGRTEERRSESDVAIGLEAETVESVLRRAGAPAHLIGHSFGGVVALEVAFRRCVPLASLTLIEANACELLRQAGDLDLFTEVETFSSAFVQAYQSGERDAARRVIDFWTGAGSFDRLPPKVRDYAVASTPANVLDWPSMYSFDRPISAYASLDVPILVIRGTDSHPATRRVSEILARICPRASLAEIAGASHLMIATHPNEVARLLGDHVMAAAHGDGELS